MPQTPCPDVQPVAMRVPTPTKRPETMMTAQLLVRFVSAPPMKTTMNAGTATRPAINDSCSQARCRSDPSTKPPTRPEAPIIRPFTSKKSAAANPISPPPMRAQIQCIPLAVLDRVDRNFKITFSVVFGFGHLARPHIRLDRR